MFTIFCPVAGPFGPQTMQTGMCIPVFLNHCIVCPERSSRDTIDLRSFCFRVCRFRRYFIVSPEPSSRDTMDLRSFRRVRRRVRTDFLVNALQGAILNRFFCPNFLCV